ncbi:MAG: SGNH/GDSL hydrolase family protein [Candidatus Omnitrophota bacterium]
MKFRITWFRKKAKIKYKVNPGGIFALILFSVLLAFLCGEILVRSVMLLPVKKEYLRFSCYEYRKIPGKNRDRDLFWKPLEDFRNVKYLKKKDKNTFRIICIGDSITQGDAQEKGLLPLEQTYVYKLEQLLAAKYKNKKIEVMNAGRGGYSSLQGLRYLKKTLWEYEPDLVISWFGVNDYFHALFYSDKEQRVPEDKDNINYNILEKSKLFLFIKNFTFIKKSLKNPVVRVPPEDFYKNCEEMIIFGREKGFKIVFVAPFQSGLNNKIEYFEGYPEKLDELEKKYGCEVLYLNPFFLGKDMKSLYADSCHFNNEGNTIVAGALFELLRGQWDKYLKKAR